MGDSEPYDEARLLLINNKWNKHRAFRAFTENADRARLDSGISPNLPVPVDSNIDLEVECQMCNRSRFLFSKMKVIILAMYVKKIWFFVPPKRALVV